MKKVFKIEDYSGKYVMHCKTKEESDRFIKYLDSVGRKWCAGEKYTEWENWDKHREDTCYNFNDNKFDNLEWYKNGGYTILEFSDFMRPEFTKSDLKDGMVVEYKNGDRRIVLNNCVMNPNRNGYLDFSDYHDDLTTKSGNRGCDIVRVYSSTGKNISSYCDDEKLTLIWERKPTHKYKPGDKVKVRSDISSYNIYGKIGFVASMDDFIGKVVTIKDTVFNRCGVPAYYISEDEQGWYWSDEMFEDGVVTHKYKAGDKVKVREDLKHLEYYGGIGVLSDMCKLKGKTVTIKNAVTTGSGCHVYNIDESYWHWTDEMFEGLVDYEEMTVAEIEKKLGYKIKVVGNDA